MPAAIVKQFPRYRYVMLKISPQISAKWCRLTTVKCWNRGLQMVKCETDRGAYLE